MKVAIYRAGSLTVPEHNESLLEYWFGFDHQRPEGHQPRSTALFASPELLGAHHWLYSRAHRENTPFYEITVESDNVRVYSVADYDRTGEFNHGSPSQRQLEIIDDYWNTSLTLTDWLHQVGYDELGEWEVLLPLSEIITARSLTFDELREKYEEEGFEYNVMEELEEDIRLKLIMGEELAPVI